MTGPAPEIAQEVLAQRKELVEIYTRAQERLVKRLTSAKLTDFAKFRIQEQLVQINAIIGALNAEVREAMPGVISGYYQHGANIADLALNAQGVKVSALNMGNRIHTAAVKAVAEQMALDLATANATMKTTATRILRQTQQTLVEERRINQLIADGIVTGESRRETSARLKEALINEIGEGKLVQAGGRYFTPEYYSELVTRTRTREAVTQGAVTRSMEYGITLFQVSIHDKPCDRCAQYQGKVYSITPDSGFPMLEARPPFHPHCFLPGTKVFAPDLCAAFESHYDGPIVSVWMESGKRFDVTPNHPILCPDRFVRAGDLEAGMILVSMKSSQDGVNIASLYERNCVVVSSQECDVNAFHGDGAHMQQHTKIAIPVDPSMVDCEIICELGEAAGPAEGRFTDGNLDAKKVRAAISKGFSVDRVESVSRPNYRGKVYDLETRSGLYVAEGIVSSNCRHVLLPYVPRPGKEDQHEAIKALSNSKTPITGGLPGYTEAVAQARETGGLRKKQLPGETRTVTPPVQTGPTGADVRKKIAEMVDRNDLFTEMSREVQKLYPGNPSAERLAAPLKFKATGSMPKAMAEAKFNEGTNAFFRMVSESSLPQGAFKPAFHSQKSRRAFYSLERQEVNLQHDNEQKIIIHEMGHWLEHKNPRITKAANDFLEARTKGEAAQKLSKLTGNRGYKADEIAKKDNFKHPYTGKIYPKFSEQKLRQHGYPEGATLRCTEITSMGLEAMFESPWNFAEDDPDFFDFIWDVIMSGKEYP